MLTEIDFQGQDRPAQGEAALGKMGRGIPCSDFSTDPRGASKSLLSIQYVAEPPERLRGIGERLLVSQRRAAASKRASSAGHRNWNWRSRSPRGPLSVLREVAVVAHDRERPRGGVVALEVAEVTLPAPGRYNRP